MDISSLIILINDYINYIDGIIGKNYGSENLILNLNLLK